MSFTSKWLWQTTDTSAIWRICPSGRGEEENVQTSTTKRKIRLITYFGVMMPLNQSSDRHHGFAVPKKHRVAGTTDSRFQRNSSWGEFEYFDFAGSALEDEWFWDRIPRQSFGLPLCSFLNIPLQEQTQQSLVFFANVPLWGDQHRRSLGPLCYSITSSQGRYFGWNPGDENLRRGYEIFNFHSCNRLWKKQPHVCAWESGPTDGSEWISPAVRVFPFGLSFFLWNPGLKATLGQRIPASFQDKHERVVSFGVLGDYNAIHGAISCYGSSRWQWYYLFARWIWLFLSPAAPSLDNQALQNLSRLQQLREMGGERIKMTISRRQNKKFLPVGNSGLLLWCVLGGLFHHHDGSQLHGKLL